MTCPACQSRLQLAEREGVQIDVCPRCRGIWLDPGELDQFIRYRDLANSLTQVEWAHGPGQGARNRHKSIGSFAIPGRKRKTWREDEFALS